MNGFNAIVVSGSSDIGAAAIRHWLDRGCSVTATFRRRSAIVDELTARGAHFVACDLDSAASVEAFAAFCRDVEAWDVFMTCPATMEPISPFDACNFSDWERSVSLNFTRQMALLHAALPRRRRAGALPPLVILWAGPGANNAPLNYSAEIVAKIAQIKMCELLDAEIADCRFVIVGPGWVKTKIHEETLRAGDMAGTNHYRTIEKLAGAECTPMERVIAFLDWCLVQPKSVVSGRNFSVVNDIWVDERLAKKLAETPDMFKMRRFLNDWNED